MNSIANLCALAAASALALTACGGSDDDGDLRPTNEPGVLKVTEASLPGLDGVYGNGRLNLSSVEKANPIGSEPERCKFKFDGADRLGSNGTAFGDIRYRTNANVLYEAFLTFNGIEFAISSGDGSGTSVVRDRDQVRFDNKLLTSTDGRRATLRVNGIVTMLGGRPSGC